MRCDCGRQNCNECTTNKSPPRFPMKPRTRSGPIGDVVGLTEKESGYPLLFQSGETAHGVQLHDHQHPHDLFSEPAVDYSARIGKRATAYLYLGYPGEPAPPLSTSARLYASRILFALSRVSTSRSRLVGLFSNERAGSYTLPHEGRRFSGSFHAVLRQSEFDGNPRGGGLLFDGMLPCRPVRLTSIYPWCSVTTKR